MARDYFGERITVNRGILVDFIFYILAHLEGRMKGLPIILCFQICYHYRSSRDLSFQHGRRNRAAFRSLQADICSLHGYAYGEHQIGYELTPELANETYYMVKFLALCVQQSRKNCLQKIARYMGWQKR